MKESVEKRMKLVRDAETPEDLKKHLCPFFEKGGHVDCVSCRRTESDLDECRDYYLERIVLHPMDIWSEEFDKFAVQSRDKVNLEEVVGIGINCDSCYMSDKCPLYKKGFVCGIKWDTNKPKTPMEFMDFLINVQYERVKRTSIFEKIDGGVPDANLSSEMDRLTDFINTKDAMGREKLSINLEASGPSHSSGGGILSKIFGGGNAAPAVEAKPTRALPTETAEYVEVIEEPEKVKRGRKHEND